MRFLVVLVGIGKFGAAACTGWGKSFGWEEICTYVLCRVSNEAGLLLCKNADVAEECNYGCR